MLPKPIETQWVIEYESMIELINVVQKPTGLRNNPTKPDTVLIMVLVLILIMLQLLILLSKAKSTRLWHWRPYLCLS